MFINTLTVRSSWLKKNTAPVSTPDPSFKFPLYFRLRITGLHDLWCLSQLCRAEEQRFSSYFVDGQALLLLKAGKGPFQNAFFLAKSTYCLHSCLVHGQHPERSLLELQSLGSSQMSESESAFSLCRRSLSTAEFEKCCRACLCPTVQC